MVGSISYLYESLYIVVLVPKHPSMKKCGGSGGTSSTYF
jgi:hypothetical protein